MKLLFDENISYRVLKHIASSIVANHVSNLGLINAVDQEIWDYAKNNDFLIVTQDSDFNDLYLLNGFPPKIIWIKSGNLKTSEIAELIRNNHEQILEFNKDQQLGLLEIWKSH